MGMWNCIYPSPDELLNHMNMEIAVGFGQTRMCLLHQNLNNRLAVQAIGLQRWPQDAPADNVHHDGHPRLVFIAFELNEISAVMYAPHPIEVPT